MRGWWTLEEGYGRRGPDNFLREVASCSSAAAEWQGVVARKINSLSFRTSSNRLRLDIKASKDCNQCFYSWESAS